MENSNDRASPEPEELTRQEIVQNLLEMQKRIGREQAYQSIERIIRSERDSNRSVAEAPEARLSTALTRSEVEVPGQIRINTTAGEREMSAGSITVEVRAEVPAQSPINTTAREREASARRIAAEMRANQGGEGRADQEGDERIERRPGSFGVSEDDTLSEDLAAANQRARDQVLFDQDVQRLRHFFSCLRISTIHKPFFLTEATHWAPPGANGTLPDTFEAQRNARGTPECTITARFTTRRPVPSHNARGIRRAPTLVFCLPPVTRDVDAFLETLPRPCLDAVDEDNKRCHICHDAYSTDGRAVGAGPGTAWLHEDRPEIPLLLPCGHVLGSHCLAQWFGPSANSSCVICRHTIFELNGTFHNTQLRPDVLEALFKLARIMGEQGQISGMEYTYGYTGSMHPEHIQLRVPAEAPDPHEAAIIQEFSA